MSTTQTYDVVAGPDVPEEEWLDARRPFAGASETAAILGLSPYSTPYDVWASKRPGAQPIQENRFITWGRRLEPVVAEWLEHDYPEVGHLLPSPGLLASRTAPFLAATPDRENTWDEDGFVTAVTELKTGSAFTRKAWWDAESGEPAMPGYYEVQTQQQMFVRGVRKGYLGALLGGNELVLREVEYNERFIEILVNEVGEWWERHIVGDTPPPATARDVWRFDGSRKDEGAVKIEATPRIMALVEKRNRLQPRVAMGKRLDDEIKGEIQAFMQDATVLVAPDGRELVTWYRGADKETTDWKALEAAHPAIVKEFMVTRPGTRTMYFKKS